jgi:hypothetical protein
MAEIGRTQNERKAGLAPAGSRAEKLNRPAPPFPQPARVLVVVEHRNDDDLLTLDKVVNPIESEPANRRTVHISETEAVTKGVLDNHRNGVVPLVEEIKSESGFLLFISRGRRVGFSSDLRQLFERVRHGGVGG